MSIKLLEEFVDWLVAEGLLATVLGVFHDGTLLLEYPLSEKDRLRTKLRELFPDGVWSDDILKGG